MSALAPLGAAGANQPIAFANYSDSEQLPFGEAIQTSCIIERTLGDRRLGSHVLSGLELLLPLLIDASKLDFSALRGAFPAARPLEVDTVVDTSSFIADHVLGATYARTADADTVACFGLKPFYDGGAGLAFNGLPRDATTLASLSTAAAASAALRAAERAPSATAKPPAQYTVAGPREMTPQWLPLWRKCCDDLNEALAVLPPTRSLLSYVYARLGADAGACIRGLHNAGINWGAFALFRMQRYRLKHNAPLPPHRLQGRIRMHSVMYATARSTATHTATISSSSHRALSNPLLPARNASSRCSTWTWPSLPIPL